jgi:lipoprotein-anchoring transpeptidase ErfK/SrfK
MEADPEPATLAAVEKAPASRVPFLLTLFLVLALVALSRPAAAQTCEAEHAQKTAQDLQNAGLVPDETEKAVPLEDFCGPPTRDGLAGLAVPFGAWAATAGYVRKEPRVGSRLTGVLQRGDTVSVTACVPDCKAAKAWAILGADGAVPLHLLRELPVPEAAYGTSSAARYEYGRVGGGRPPVFAKPDAKSRLLRHEKSDFRLAFVPNPGEAQRGWLQRPDGGWMRSKDVKLFTPSKFEGVRDGSQGAIVFVRRKTILTPPKDPKVKAAKPTPEEVLARTVNRYDHLPLLAEKNGRVYVPGGSLPASLVRIVRQVPIPKGISAEDHWIHIDLAQQVLVAYEGDHRVLATLISSGKSDLKSHMTHKGTFRIYAKSVHTSMRGKPWDDYYAEEVPWTMHYDDGRALHGAYWHDQFGVQKSHGCVNLSPADAAWLFQWVPPKLPDGWHSVLAVSGKLSTAWVIVDDPDSAAKKLAAGKAHSHVARR